MTTSRVVRKSLAGLEDFLLGKGSATQTRNGQDYPITKLNLIWPVYSQAELDALDTTLAKHALFEGKILDWSGTAWVDSYEEQTATAGQTAFTVTSTLGKNYYINGVKQARSSYTVTSDTVVTFSAGLDLGDIVEISS